MRVAGRQCQGHLRGGSQDQGEGWRAGLEYSFTGKSKDRSQVLVAKAESTYAVAKEKCDDKAGNDKDVCLKEAKAVEVKALADAKLGKEIGEARKEAADEKRDADYKVAIEKCDALDGVVPHLRALTPKQTPSIATARRRHRRCNRDR